jgi:hypothetical protein
MAIVTSTASPVPFIYEGVPFHARGFALATVYDSSWHPLPGSEWTEHSKPSVTDVPAVLDAACGPIVVGEVSTAVRLGQGFDRGLLGGLADVVVNGFADDASGQVVEMGVELLGECEVFGPEGFLVELLGGA